MSEHQVLVVDDEADIRELLAITLERMKLRSMAAATIAEAKVLLKHQSFDLCLTDLRLPDGEGLELVEHIQKNHPTLPVAVITAHGSMEAAIQALKLGAFDFVSKPIHLQMLRDLVASAIKLADPPTTREAPQADQLLGASHAMQALKTSISKLSRSLAPLCILGESGSGKERVAREVHRQSPRAKHPFVAVNCGAIPSELMESEFFGHVRGSFTGAISDKPGLFRAATGGTLFLDEVAELPLPMQVKLLRVIQERAVKSVGATQETPVDVRIISATHRNLAEDVRSGRFRQDLFYRINVIELKVPPLRERRDDIALLARHFLTRIAVQLASNAFRLSKPALDKLETYHFPGNVRELENILERAAALSEGETIDAQDIQLPNSLNEPSAAKPGGLGDYLEDETRRAILSALEKTHWNRSAAARILGISLRQLRYRLQKYELE